MQLYYIRHAQSHNNALYDRTGSNNDRHADPEITEIGWRQARLVADTLALSGPGAQSPDFDLQNRLGFGITHIYCSLMVRSIQTGDVIAKALNLPLAALMDLHEGGGIFEKEENSEEYVGLPGNTSAFFRENFPDLILPEAMNSSGWWNRPFESSEARRERAHRILEFLLQRHDGTEDRIALISHGGFYNYFLSEILRIPPRPAKEEHIRRPGAWLSLNNVAITRLDWLADETRLVYHNRLDFLPADLIT